MRRKLKIHYYYKDEESPPNATFCTPKSPKEKVTENPQEVTCKKCWYYAEDDAAEAERLKERANEPRPWYRGLIKLNRTKRLHLMVCALLSLLDGVIILVSLGYIVPYFEFSYIIRSLLGGAVDKNDLNIDKI